MFERIAGLVPSRIAVTEASGATVTYGELHSVTDRIARHLRVLGVGPEFLVALRLPRSLDLVLGALSILKAGGAYLPIDPALPPDRSRFILDDAQVGLMLTRADLEPIRKANCKLVDIQLLAKTETGTAIADHTDADPNRLAYVIYTSGSTGAPKGVEVTHANLLNLVQWHLRAFHLGQQDRTTLVANVGFDASVWEMWPSLAAGASLLLPDDETIKVASLLRDWLIAEQITVSFVPTPVAEQLIDLEWPSAVPLRVLLTGGDVLHQHAPPNLPFTLVNNYGPTECTVVATSGVVASGDGTQGMPPIGRPIDNASVYVLDENARRVAPEQLGELYIGGAGVARGYRNRPELTFQRFIQSPFPEHAGAMLYKTGDLGRCLPDGDFGFAGRIDEQVKIRGCRIEPNEIVAVLNSHPSIQASTVIATSQCEQEPRLLAYIVMKDGLQPFRSELIEFLRFSLPEYMIPSVLVRVLELPVNANGKVDRAALPAPDASNLIKDQEVVAPSNEVERRLVAILVDLLGLESVSMTDNFFLLGGHSLLGAQLIAKVHQRFGVKLTLRNLFSNPTIAGMAAEISRLMRPDMNGAAAKANS
jgi:amino acid adenylation domain-containing protein